MIKSFKILMLSTSLLPLWSEAQIELFLVERSQAMVQTGADTLVPFGDHTNFQFGGNYTAWIEIFTGGETITGARASIPSMPEGFDLEYDAEDDAYLENGEYAQLSEIRAALPAGTVTFTGTGSQTGAFNESLTIGQYTPLSPLKIVNFDALQSFDITKDLVIQWEPFTEAGGLSDGPNLGYYGLINVEITGYTESQVIDAWDSESITPDGGFGLIPTTNSVTIPAGTLQANTAYIVNVFFAKIESASAASSGALKAVVNGYEVEFNIYQDGTAPVDTDWAGFPIDANGWINTAGWMGYLNVGKAPWLWSDKLQNWVYSQENTVSAGGGWMYIVK